MKYIKNFIRLSWQEKYLLVEACVLLGLFRLVILLMPFKKIEPHLGQHMVETSTENTVRDRIISKMVARAVTTMSRHTLWESKCLVQAMTAKYMLRKRGVKSTLYLGVARNKQEAMIAHAWLRSGEKIITGARESRRFTSVSYFGDL